MLVNMRSARPALTKREKEILDIVYERGQATAAEVRGEMTDPPTDAGVRTILRVLVGKGHLRIEQDGPRYNYLPTVPREKAQRSELGHVVQTFFGGSVESALSALLDLRPGELDDAERRRLKRLIDKAAKEDR
jgi:BlaI family transcriptional regulator, penicillinase repressor